MRTEDKNNKQSREGVEKKITPEECHVDYIMSELIAANGWEMAWDMVDTVFASRKSFSDYCALRKDDEPCKIALDIVSKRYAREKFDMRKVLAEYKTMEGKGGMIAQ